jgi:4-aminobutyrate--pyruvate transaminase
LRVHGNSAASRDIASVLHPYTNLKIHQEKGPLIITHGSGVNVYDEHGKEYIEGLSGLWCVSLGFSESRLVEAARRQMETLPYYHSFASKSHGPAIELAERLLDLLPAAMSKVFFNSSGSEANDTAIKLCWYYNNALGRPQKKKIISRIKGYHGVTIASASLTGLPNNHRDFDLPIAGVLHTGCPHYYRFGRADESEEEFASRLAAELNALIVNEGPDTVAAFIAEPVMGAGGVLVPPQTYFSKIQTVLKKHDVLFIVDEVICGFGRLGTMFGFEHFEIEPDMVVMAKQITSGYQPLSATVISEQIYQALVRQSEKIGVFAHGFTYSGHPVAAAVGVETLKIYEERRMLDHVRSVAPYFQERLRRLESHSLVGEVRGLGLIGALELARDKKTKEPFPATFAAGALAGELAQENGLILRAIGDTLALCPPLIIDEKRIDRIFDRLGPALDQAAAELKRRGAL